MQQVAMIILEICRGNGSR